MNLEELRKFIIEASEHGYGAGVSSKLEQDGSHTITYESGGYKLHDNFFGGEPYGGREIIFHQDKPYWMMVYYGAVTAKIDHNLVYAVLKKALINYPKGLPLRGPANLKEGDFEYQNKWHGNLASYSGREKILKDGKEIYFADYSGGLVDQKA